MKKELFKNNFITEYLDLSFSDKKLILFNNS